MWDVWLLDCFEKVTDVWFGGIKITWWQKNTFCHWRLQLRERTTKGTRQKWEAFFVLLLWLTIQFLTTTLQKRSGLRVPIVFTVLTRGIGFGIHTFILSLMYSFIRSYVEMSQENQPPIQNQQPHNPLLLVYNENGIATAWIQKSIRS